MAKISLSLWKTRSGRFLLFTLLFTRSVFILSYRSKKYAKLEIPCIFVLRGTQCFTTNQWHIKLFSRISANFISEIKKKDAETNQRLLAEKERFELSEKTLFSLEPQTFSILLFTLLFTVSVEVREDFAANLRFCTGHNMPINPFRHTIRCVSKLICNIIDWYSDG